MDDEKKLAPPQEICSMRIMFPVSSDEDALNVKHKVAEVLKGVEQVRTEFSISSMRT